MDVSTPEFIAAVVEEARQGWSAEQIAVALDASVEEVEGAICSLWDAEQDTGPAIR